MFRKSDQQSNLLAANFLLKPAKRQRLERSWAAQFRDIVLPLIEEEHFRDCFHVDNGRPNFPIRTLVGLQLLKEMSDLTDAEVCEQFAYNLQWHHALAVAPDEAHVAARTLFNFRRRLMERELVQVVFVDITRKLAEHSGIKLGRQRLDSTHIMSNIRSLTRLGLLCETNQTFLDELERCQPEAHGQLEEPLRRRYQRRDGEFADVKKAQARRRLLIAAQDMFLLERRFAEQVEVRELASFVVLQRVFGEQCEVVQRDGGAEAVEVQDVGVFCGSEGGDEGGDDDGDDGGGDGNGGSDGSGGGGGGEGAHFVARAGEAVTVSHAADSATPAGQDLPAAVGAEPAEPTVRLRDPKTIRGSSVQSPHDTDATYGHKGKGFSCQLSETHDPTNPFQLVTAVNVHGANESDQNKTVAMVDQLRQHDLAPTELLADTGYGSGANIVAAAERGVRLLAPVQDPSAPKDEPPHWRLPEQGPAPEREPSDFDAIVVTLAAFTMTATYDQVLACPDGAAPESHRFVDGVLHATFAAAACRGCPLATTCLTQERKDGSRTLRRSAAAIATEVRQYQQQQSAFKRTYRARSGIEATNSELKRKHGLRKLRVRGAARVGLAAHFKVLALNVRRAVRHYTGQAEATEPPPTSSAAA
jgi:hypothetical protein